MCGVSSNANVIYIREVIERVEELREEFSDLPERESNEDAYVAWDADGPTELAQLLDLLAECCGNGGDEQWEGGWYPATLIRDSYFEDYAREFAEDIGAINSKANWPNNCIDWKQAARELQMDYSVMEYNGVAYWYR